MEGVNWLHAADEWAGNYDGRQRSTVRPALDQHPSDDVPSGTPAPWANRATENPLMSSALDSCPRLLPRSSSPSPGWAAVSCPENPFGSMERGRSGTEPGIALWSGDTSCSPAFSVFIDASSTRDSRRAASPHTLARQSKSGVRKNPGGLRSGHCPTRFLRQEGRWPALTIRAHDVQFRCAVALRCRSEDRRSLACAPSSSPARHPARLRAIQIVGVPARRHFRSSWPAVCTRAGRPLNKPQEQSGTSPGPGTPPTSRRRISRRSACRHHVDGRRTARR